MRLVGTIQAIVLRNINKAAGRFTYNVELEVARHADEVVCVRVGKLYGDAVGAELAPNGLQHELRAQRWREFNVGEAIDLDVSFSSPRLAHHPPLG